MTHMRRVAILGTGNIGTDLLFKTMKSKHLHCVAFIGRNPDSKNIKLANDKGIATSYKGIQEILDHPDDFDIIFDATSAKEHLRHAPLLKSLNKFVIDLTPAKIGKICVPSINIKEIEQDKNINLITCGGQASIPLLHGLSKTNQDIRYIEVTTTVASVCAGPATRENIDEYLKTTEYAITHFTQCKNVKVMLNLNPAVPEIDMQVALRIVIEEPDLDVINTAINQVLKKIQEKLPGYQLAFPPSRQNDHIFCLLKVRGSGDYLPKYAGCLDIITQAAISVAEEVQI